VLKHSKANVPGLRQESQFTCMATSLTAAMHAHGKNVTEGDVNRVMGASPLRGASWEELLATAQYFGMRGTLVVPATLSMLKAWTDKGVPVIIAWNPENRPWSHASVVVDVKEDGTVHVMDPNIPDPSEHFRVVSSEMFHKNWGEPLGDKMIVRRPACAIEREISPEGRQMVASKLAAVNEKLMDRASNLLGYMDERDAIRHLIKEGVSRQDAFLATKAGKKLMKDRMQTFERGRRDAGYKGNPDGGDIYENEVGHGYGEPLAGGTDVMRKLQNRLLHEQGNPQRPESPRLAAQVVNIPGKGKVPIPKGIDVLWTPETRRAWVVSWNGKILRTITDGDELFYFLTRDLQHVHHVGSKVAAVTEPEAIDFLNGNMVPFQKGTGWWLPAHNLGINQPPMGGLNLWAYTILPMFPRKEAYVPPGDNPVTAPAGIVIRPVWVPHKKYADRIFPGDMGAAEAVVKQARIAPSVTETTKQEFAWLEKTFGITIPNTVKSKYAQQAPKLAARRWGVDRTRTSRTFVPLDGRKPVPMPLSGRPTIRAAIHVANRYMDRLEGTR